MCVCVCVQVTMFTWERPPSPMIVYVHWPWEIGHKLQILYMYIGHEKDLPSNGVLFQTFLYMYIGHGKDLPSNNVLFQTFLYMYIIFTLAMGVGAPYIYI